MVLVPECWRGWFIFSRWYSRLIHESSTRNTIRHLLGAWKRTRVLFLTLETCFVNCVRSAWTLMDQHINSKCVECDPHGWCSLVAFVQDTVVTVIQLTHRCLLCNDQGVLSAHLRNAVRTSVRVRMLCATSLKLQRFVWEGKGLLPTEGKTLKTSNPDTECYKQGLDFPFTT